VAALIKARVYVAQFGADRKFSQLGIGRLLAEVGRGRSRLMRTELITFAE
jgi:hypothetical protein